MDLLTYHFRNTNMKNMKNNEQIKRAVAWSVYKKIIAEPELRKDPRYFSLFITSREITLNHHKQRYNENIDDTILEEAIMMLAFAENKNHREDFIIADNIFDILLK